MASIKIVQRTKTLSNGLFPIFLRVTKDRKTKFISLNLACDKTQWNQNKSEFRKNFTSYKQYNNSLTEIKSRAENIFSSELSDGNDITLEEFNTQFFDFKSDKKVKILEAFDEYITELLSSNRTGNARYYKDTKASFSKFLNGKDVYFKTITVKVLKNVNE